MIVERGHIEAALPGYQLGAVLGRGGFGLVVAAWHRRLARPVAVKVLDVGIGESARFAAEAQILANIDHPHVGRVHDYAEAGDLCMIVMEHLPGGSLRDRAADGQSPETGCAVGLAIAEALECAHTVGVLHRDVKPENILIAADGTPKLIDFGVAKIFEGSPKRTSTRIGTLCYMAPEQWRNERLVPATDLYALGVVVYELLVGGPPFGRNLSPAALRQRHLDAVPPPLPGVPEPVAAVILRALAKDVAGRQHTARTFAVELARAAVDVFGSDWLSRSELHVQLSDEVRDAARTAPRRPPRHASPDPPPSTAAPSTAAPTTVALPTSSRPRAVDRPGRGVPRPRRRWFRRLRVATGFAAALAVAGTLTVFVALPDRSRSAGHAAAAYSGPTVHAYIDAAVGVAVDDAGNLYVSEWDDGRVWRVDTGGRVRPVAGTGTAGHSGDGGPAVTADLLGPDGIAAMATANYLIAGFADLLVAEVDSHRVRWVDADGRIRTVAGTGTPGFSGDGGPAVRARLNGPVGIAVGPGGTLYIADRDNHRVRWVDADGRIRTVAGTGTAGDSGDGGPAVRAQLNGPVGIAVGPGGTLYIADRDNHRVRQVDADGRIRTVAGTGEAGYSGDGGPAGRAHLARPDAVALDTAGNLYIVDSGNHRVRRVDADGQVRTVAGTGAVGGFGDGGPAMAAHLEDPADVAVDAAGNLYIVDSNNGRVRRVGSDNRISTVID